MKELRADRVRPAQHPDTLPRRPVALAPHADRLQPRSSSRAVAPVKNYAKAVRLVLERERTNGATFDDAWSHAVAEHPAPADWLVPEQSPPLAYLRRVFSLAYHGEETPAMPITEGDLPMTKDPTPKADTGLCRSPTCDEARVGEKWCATHGALFARLREDLTGESVPRLRLERAA